MKEQIYEIKLGESSSAIIEWKQTEFMGKVFELAKESKLIVEKLEITKTRG